MQNVSEVNNVWIIQEKKDLPCLCGTSYPRVITERTKKLFTDNVRFRTAPSTNAETQIVDLYDISTGEITDVLRKGTVFATYARTESTEIIDGIESPWYYIRVDGQYGWVFGGYFTDYIEADE